MGWHPTETRLRFSSHRGGLEDEDWHRGLAVLATTKMIGEVEVFSSQLASFAKMAAAHPTLRFVLPVMGWPVDTSEAGRLIWRNDLRQVAACRNVSIKIFGLECIFGVQWTLPQVRPWILDAIEAFSPQRCMFASHMPICGLACSMAQLYAAYDDVTAGFSEKDRRSMFCDVAKGLYFTDE
jgi:predicted TIM-barrel fold metal-dependent hydrolase